MGKTKSPPSDGLAASIRAALPDGKPGFACWNQRIPPDVLAELEALRDEFRAGQLQGTLSGLAKTIARELRSRGISEIGPQGVHDWLKK